MSSDFDHLHLKRNTAGSSNELSFDVLDAARVGVDSKRDTRGRSPKGSYHGVKGAATLSGQDEVVRRKRERKSHAAKLWVVAIVAGVAVLAACISVGYSYYRGVQDFSSRFDDLVQGFVQVDTQMTDIDEFMARPLAANVETCRRVSEEAAQAAPVLEQLKAGAQSARPAAMDERGGTALEKVEAAADARLSMVDIAERTLAEITAANEESSEANAAWNDVLDADQAARKATGSANGAGTEADVQKAREETEAARAQMEAARQKLAEIDQVRDDLDLTDQETYLQKRIEALDHALATSDALLAGDRELAASENEAYNTADKEAVALAEALPLSIEDVVEDSHQADLDALQQEYEAARDKAIEADSLIREYRRL